MNQTMSKLKNVFRDFFSLEHLLAWFVLLVPSVLGLNRMAITNLPNTLKFFSGNIILELAVLVSSIGLSVNMMVKTDYSIKKLIIFINYTFFYFLFTSKYIGMTNFALIFPTVLSFFTYYSLFVADIKRKRKFFCISTALYFIVFVLFFLEYFEIFNFEPRVIFENGKYAGRISFSYSFISPIARLIPIVVITLLNGLVFSLFRKRHLLSLFIGFLFFALDVSFLSSWSEIARVFIDSKHMF